MPLAEAIDEELQSTAGLSECANKMGISVKPRKGGALPRTYACNWPRCLCRACCASACSYVSAHGRSGTALWPAWQVCVAQAAFETHSYASLLQCQVSTINGPLGSHHAWM